MPDANSHVCLPSSFLQIATPAEEIATTAEGEGPNITEEWPQSDVSEEQK